MAGDKRDSRIGWPLAIATGLGSTFVAFTLMCFGDILVAPYHADFISLWSAGHMVLRGQLGSVYNIAAHHSVERTLSPAVGMLQPPPSLGSPGRATGRKKSRFSRRQACWRRRISSPTMAES